MAKETLDIVVGGYIVNNGRLLLIHHKKLNKWLPVGGHIDANETPDDALRREIREETGLEIDFVHYPLPRRGNKNDHALPFYVNKHHITDIHFHYCLFYLCKPKTTNIDIAKKEILSYGWFSQNELKSLNPPLDEGNIITCLEALKLAESLSETKPFRT